MRTARIISAAVLVAGALMLMSCRAVTEGTRSEDGLQSLDVRVDTARGVVCYSDRFHTDTLSCVKVRP